jgi:hypothetical protein
MYVDKLLKSTDMEILEKLFGSASKVKIMRLFIFNPDHFFDPKAVSLRSRINIAQARKDMSLLQKIGLIKPRGAKGNRRTWFLNEEFPYLLPLRELMSYTISVSYEEMVKKLSRVCKLKSLVLSGLFINHFDSRADMLIIGNSIQKDALHLVIKKMESEIGRELKYAVLDTDDFKYRLSVGDRLVRDILEYPHRIAFDRIGIQ